MESNRAEQSSVTQELEGLRGENEELKEVLSAVQLDLEAGTEVSETEKQLAHTHPLLCINHYRSYIRKRLSCRLFMNSYRWPTQN